MQKFDVSNTCYITLFNNGDVVISENESGREPPNNIVIFKEEVPALIEKLTKAMELSK